MLSVKVMINKCKINMIDYWGRIWRVAQIKIILKTIEYAKYWYDDQEQGMLELDLDKVLK